MNNYDGLYDKNIFGANLVQNHFSDKKIHFRILERATILPHRALDNTNGFGGIVDEKGNFIEGSAVHRGTCGAYTPNEPVQQSPLTVVYIGMFVHIWGHSLTDGLSRLWFLRSEVYQKYFRHCPLVFNPMWGGILPNFTKLLQILEVDTSKMMMVNHPIQCQTIILPDESWFINQAGVVTFTNEYVETVERVRNFAQKIYQPLEQKKFYFYHGQKEMNEARLAQYFESKGFTTIRPETLPLEAQLNILTNAESFASSLGSISHNVMFMRENTEIILIPRYAMNNLNMYQQALEQIRNYNVFYIDSTLSAFAPSHNGLFFYVVSRQLRNYFGDDSEEIYSEEDLEKFCEYTRFSIMSAIPTTPLIQQYYAKVMPEVLNLLNQRPALMQKYGLKFN